ncbi:MAG: AhpC/TSA family protein [Ignavibacteria bacterium]|nr:AhpC/TSA family protein [Ignavibacteria bacterium]
MIKLTFIFILAVLSLPNILYSQTKERTIENAPLSAEDIDPILTGSKIPDVTLADINGNAVELLKKVSEKPSILIFYRGGWCPYCNTQLSQIQEIDSELQNLGYEIIAVSPDRPEELKRSIDKNKINYTLLSDSSMNAGLKFGIAFKVADEIIEKYKTYDIDLEASSGMDHHLLPVPSVFILGTDGIVKFSYVNPNYKIRLDPDELMAAAVAGLK